MEKNQNDPRNQHSDHKSTQHSNPDDSKRKETTPDKPTANQHSTPDDFRKKEATPDKPTANQGKEHGTQPGSLQHNDLTQPTSKKQSDVRNTDENESRERNQNPTKGNK